MAQTCKWGSTDFTVYEAAATTWNDRAGVYVFATVTPQNYWKALYIGQADSFQNRLPSHERWDEAARLGATHIHAAVVPQAVNRDSLEKSLIAQYQPPLNSQHK